MRRTHHFLPLLLLLLCAAPPPVSAADLNSLGIIFTRGNEEYQRGEFAAAERSYQELLGRGVESGALYYNLGNVCFKQKKIGEAIYYWEKAKKMMPGDRDIEENLALANLMVVDRVEVPPDPFPVRAFNRLQELLSVNQATWLVLFLFVAANLFFSVYLLAASQRLCMRALAAALISGALVLILGSALSWRIYSEHTRMEGIVTEQKADVRSGPGPDNITVFTVHEGIKVRVRGETSGWYQVSLPNGWNGWLQAGALRIL
jgi:tetratricopeptide (TPR) repeat protein